MRKYHQAVLLGLVFLFLLQTISDFIESIYAFGLLRTSFTIEIASIVLFFAPLALLFFRGGMKRPVLIGLALVGLVCRVAETMLPPTGKMLAAGLSMAALALFLLGWLAQGRVRGGQAAGLGLILALLLSIFLRTAGSGSDVSLTNPLVGLVLAGLAGWLLFEAELEAQPTTAQAARASFGRLAGLSLGVAGVFWMADYAFASPTVIARWTGFSYLGIVCTLAVSLLLFAVLLGSAKFAGWLGRGFILAWNGLFVLALVLTILPHQVAFPTDPAAYPIDAAPASPLAGLPLIALLALAPVLAVDLALLLRAIAGERPSTPQTGGAFSLAALYFLVMVFLQVFTTIYDYAPVVGPLFRDRFWLVYLLAGLGTGLPLGLVRKEQFDAQPVEVERPLVILASGLVVGTALVLAFRAVQPIQTPAQAELKVMTYNIQQGYDEQGKKNLEGQLQVIQQVNPDVLGLQESDTARAANGDVDAVRYFADRLGMHSYYGPTTTTGTFGIALLSKYPIENAETFFMYSKGEQTATIHAQVKVNGGIYNLFITHLGNGGPIFQLEDMLERIQGQENVVAMGDFNFRPPTEQYQLMTQTLTDAWLLRWPGGKDIPGFSADRRIDHIFVSPGMAVVEAEYGVDPASDHPYLYAAIQP
jgi:endonuclease/exonuclease/phosphatase family metal-dependent hydrolase